ncbi:manganese efflux pump [Sporosarcina sp. A2]|uniref:manganese efflux pump n=1 Tax=Sporosarcina sp. A2 TaxID=3393449 RepID=UPI003D7AFA44
MQWIMILFLGIAANLDNLGIGLAYGIQKTKIPFRSNVTIALVSMVVTYFAMVTGDQLSTYISLGTADLIGGLLLCTIGLWMLLQPRPMQPNPFEDPTVADTDGDRIISIREALPLGFLLSANCLAAGFGMGVGGSSMLGTITSVGFFSLITIGASHRFGSLLSRTWIGKYPTGIAGGLLIVIGIVEILF